MGSRQAMVYFTVGQRQDFCVPLIRDKPGIRFRRYPLPFFDRLQKRSMYLPVPIRTVYLFPVMAESNGARKTMVSLTQHFSPLVFTNTSSIISRPSPFRGVR